MVKQSAPSPQISRLSLVVKYSRSPIFIGWDKNGSVAASSNATQEAIDDFQSAKQSGASFPNISSDRIFCFEYSSMGKAIDYPATKEDVITVNARNEAGEVVSLNIGEGTILKAIEWSLDPDHVWNSVAETSSRDDGSGVSSTAQLYTLIFQDNRTQSGAVCALLFKPLRKGDSNENDFIKFTKAVVKQLLIIDESQPSEGRKGYISVAARASKGGYKTGLADIFFDTTDAATVTALSNAKAGGLKLLQVLGIAEVSDELISEVRDPLPSYNVNSLDLKGLSDLISAMKELAPYRNNRS